MGPRDGFEQESVRRVPDESEHGRHQRLSESYRQHRTSCPCRLQRTRQTGYDEDYPGTTDECPADRERAHEDDDPDGSVYRTR